MKNIIGKTKIEPIEGIREYYKVKTGLFGLISFEEIEREESFGKSLRICCDILPEEILIRGEKDGKEYMKKIKLF